MLVVFFISMLSTNDMKNSQQGRSLLPSHLLYPSSIAHTFLHPILAALYPLHRRESAIERQPCSKLHISAVQALKLVVSPVRTLFLLENDEISDLIYRETNPRKHICEEDDNLQIKLETEHENESNPGQESPTKD